MERRFERRLLTSAWSGYRASALGNLVGSLGLALQHAAALLLIYVGARMIIAGELSIGALIACSILAARAIAPMRQLFAAWHQLEMARHAYTRLRSLMNEPAEANAESRRTAEIEISGRIRFEDVTFAYRKGQKPALRDLSFELQPGIMLGVTGLPGSGKSTLLRLIIGLEQPDKGTIEIDGFDLNQLSAAAYRQQIGVVPQEVQLFKGTIADNIALNSGNNALPRIVAAAKFVGAHDFIQSLPEGYDTELGERGQGLSLGQRQLISIARALVRNPRILILDEATSSLDHATEANLLDNLRRAGRGRTIVHVSHKPSVLRACDLVMLIEDGILRKLGPAEECLALLKNPNRDITLRPARSL
jgi:ABC-type bacteriocin/lantibiotic exporter with double-glycine peptidase domain